MTQVNSGIDVMASNQMLNELRQLSNPAIAPGARIRNAFETMAAGVTGDASILQLQEQRQQMAHNNALQKLEILQRTMEVQDRLKNSDTQRDLTRAQVAGTEAQTSRIKGLEKKDAAETEAQKLDNKFIRGTFDIRVKSLQAKLEGQYAENAARRQAMVDDTARVAHEGQSLDLAERKIKIQEAEEARAAAYHNIQFANPEKLKQYTEAEWDYKMATWRDDASAKEYEAKARKMLQEEADRAMAMGHRDRAVAILNRLGRFGDFGADPGEVVTYAHQLELAKETQVVANMQARLGRAVASGAGIDEEQATAEIDAMAVELANAMNAGVSEAGMAIIQESLQQGIMARFPDAFPDAPKSTKETYEKMAAVVAEFAPQIPNAYERNLVLEELASWRTFGNGVEGMTFDTTSHQYSKMELDNWLRGTTESNAPSYTEPLGAVQRAYYGAGQGLYNLGKGIKDAYTEHKKAAAHGNLKGLGGEAGSGQGIVDWFARKMLMGNQIERTSTPVDKRLQYGRADIPYTIYEDRYTVPGSGLTHDEIKQIVEQ